MCLLALLSSADDSAGKARILNCYFTKSPPVMDGKMDDACWKEAPAAGNFVLHLSAAAPANSTEVRTCYDADNLYFFWTLHEKNMKGMKYGPPEDFRDNIDWNGDAAELFLAPGADRNNYYQFCASPLGARFESYIRDKFFNPDWKVKTCLHDDRWTIEMAIPFTSMTRDVEFRGTPAKGEQWGLQFCRDQGYLHEWSTWREKEHRSFHYPEYFGILRFAGFKDGDGPVSVTGRCKGISFGPDNRFEFDLSSDKKGLKAVADMLFNGKTAFRKELPLNSKTFTFDISVTRGGDWNFLVDVYSSGEKIYHGAASKMLPSIDGTFKAIAGEDAGEKIRNTAYPGKKDVLARLAALQSECSGAAEKLEKPEKISAAEWEELLRLHEKVKTAWSELSFALNLIKFYDSLKQDHVLFALGQAGPQTKVYSDTLYQGPLNSPVKMSMAGGETESKQLILIPFGTRLKDVKVSFGDLKGPGGAVIRADNFRWFAVEYVKINEKPVTKDTDFRRYVPDILRESTAFDVKPDTQRPVWLDFHLPPGTPEGTYRGEVKVSANGETVAVPVEVRAYGFDIPAVPSLKNEFWISPTLSWENFYGGFGKDGYSPEIHRRHAEVLSRYRVNPFVMHHQVYWHPANLKIYQEKDGSFSFDFSQWERFMDNGLRCGGNFFTASMGCGVSALKVFADNHPVTLRTTGKSASLYECYPDARNFKKLFDEKKYVEALRDNRFYFDFMKAYLALLKKKGLLEISGWEYFDEPASNVAWDEMLRTHAFFREKFPEMRLFAYSVQPEIVRSSRKALGYIDTWAPALYELGNAGLIQLIGERREKFGEKFFFYGCTSRNFENGDFTPYIYYHQSFLAPRMYAWMARKYNTDGFMVFMLNQIPSDDMPVKGKKRVSWPGTEWLAGKPQGCGTLVYPGPGFELIPSIRLASFRDGLEDYEYFVLLCKLQSYIDKDAHRKLYDQIEKELSIEESIIKDPYVWTKNETDLEAKRERIARLIKTAREMIRKESVK